MRGLSRPISQRWPRGRCPQTFPNSDVVAAHGLWSWVGDGARAGIVRLLGSRLRPGGLVYISYNALPRWGAALGMQRLLREIRLAACDAKRPASRRRARYRPHPGGGECATVV